MRALLLATVALASVVGAACGSSGTAAPVRTATYTFDAADTLPAGLEIGGSAEGGPARWQVLDDPEAPTPGRVLEQSDGRGENPRYCVLLSDAPVASDVRVSVRCRPLTGRLDRSAGLVFRAADDRSYYVVRANLLENDVRLYRCIDGVRQDIDAWSQRLQRDRWHELAVEMRGDRITVRWNGEVVIEAQDATFAGPGRCGIWTKADSVTRFDDLVIESLD